MILLRSVVLAGPSVALYNKAARQPRQPKSGLLLSGLAEFGSPGTRDGLAPTFLETDQRIGIPSFDSPVCFKAAIAVDGGSNGMEQRSDHAHRKT